ncbi:uncharacterized protein LOC116023472 [Ipomoea triloba]|uniref:uncharacterized protein LOC116023472 n=1 Tax=Ipomoea triloba TaxID=35885 RepID=UPI00125E8D44|nr:uncharacterized protein LOC116023472 [Ipomoea triloba]
MSKTMRKHFTQLEFAKQREGEHLSAFVERWKSAMAKIEPLDDRTAINLLLASLSAGPLYQDLIVQPPDTYDEAVKRMVDHATATEANNAKRLQESGQGCKDQKRFPDQQRKDQDGNLIYTPLTRPMAEVLEYAQACHMIQLPAPARDCPNKNKYCTYHRNRGHDTEECHVLKGLIEDLLRSGELAQFAKKKKKNRRSWKKFFKKSDKEGKGKEPDQDREPPPQGAKQVIHVIFGGPKGGDDPDERRTWSQDLPVCSIESSRPGKRLKEESITFTDHDLPQGGDRSA